MRLGLVAHNRKKLALDVGRKMIELVDELKKNGVDIDLVVSDNNSTYLNGYDVTLSPVEKMKVDAIVCIGGDGTLLRTLQHTKHPVLGVNAGSLGFLTEIPPDRMREALLQMIDGNYQIDQRCRIKTLLNGERLPDATNDVVISTSTPSKIQEFEYYIDMEWVQDVRADGIIISTPTGSTSYALSAGGPVLDPRLEAIEIIPISPFRINSRPIIIPDSSVVSLKIAHKTRSANLVIDGYFRKTVKNKDELLFTRSKNKSKFIRFDMNFYERYSEKIVRERPSLNKKGKY